MSRASAAHAIGIGHDCAASREGRFEERSIDVDAAISPAGYGIKQHMLVDLVIQSYGPARRVALVPDLPCPIRKPQRSARLALIPIHISARKCTAAPHGLRSEERRIGKECVSKCRYRWGLIQ